MICEKCVKREFYTLFLNLKKYKKELPPPPPEIRPFLNGALLIIFIASVFCSCKKSNTIEETTIAESPILNVTDGVIAFKTAVDFKNAITFYHLKPVEALQNDVKNLSGFTALPAKIPLQATATGNTATRALGDATPPAQEFFLKTV